MQPASATCPSAGPKVGAIDRSQSLAVLEREAGHILSLLACPATDAAKPVPSCPGWTLGQVPDHLGRVYAMVATVLQGDPDSPPDRATIPRRPETQSPTAWMRERLDIMVALLRDVPAETRRWNFATGPGSPVAFWWRRQMHETLVHRVDAELAAGQPVTGAEPGTAADGIGDFLVITGFHRVERDEIRLGEGMTVHLHATDAGPDAEWTIETANHTYARAHLRADVALRGPAWALDLWCWRRGSLDSEGAAHALGVEAFGDWQAAEEWRPTI